MCIVPKHAANIQAWLPSRPAVRVLCYWPCPWPARHPVVAFKHSAQAMHLHRVVAFSGTTVICSYQPTTLQSLTCMLALAGTSLTVAHGFTCACLCSCVNTFQAAGFGRFFLGVIHRCVKPHSTHATVTHACKHIFVWLNG